MIMTSQPLPDEGAPPPTATSPEVRIKTEIKEEPASQEEERSSSSDEQKEGSSEEEEEEGSSSSSSSTSSSEESGNEQLKKKFIDIRDKYDSKPLAVTTPLSTRLLEQAQSTTTNKSSRNGTTEDNVKNNKIEEIKREHPTTDESDESSPKKRISKRPKVNKNSRSTAAVDIPLSRQELLNKNTDERDYESFSDDGEDTREHGGALNGIETTPDRDGRKTSPERTKRSKPPPVVEKIVPIFPFKTKCKPGQFPESKVPFLDSHCHIDYLFVREQNFGTFASYVESKDFPKNFSGCVANFCDPPAWAQYQVGVN